MTPDEIDELTARLAAKPQDPEALAEAHRVGIGDPPAYADLLERVAEASRTDALAAHWLTQAAIVCGETLRDPKRAARLLRDAVERAPKNDKACDLLERIYRENGKQKALATFLERRADALAELCAGEPELLGRAVAAHLASARVWGEAQLGRGDLDRLAAGQVHLGLAALGLRREPELRVRLLGELTQGRHRLGRRVIEVEPVDHDDVRLEVRHVAREGDRLEDLADGGVPAADARRVVLHVPEVREDQAIALHVDADGRLLLEARRDREVVEDFVVVRPDMVDRVLVRDVQDLAVAQQVVERDLDQERGLADAGASRDEAEVAAPEAAMHGLLEDPHGAPLVHFLAVHGCPHLPFFACSSRVFLMSSSARAPGSAM